MPQYSLLGATGATGTAVLRCLLSEPPKDLKLNILIRNKTKLLNIFPRLEETEAFNVQIYEGTATDISALQKALDGSDVVINCIATNESKPGVSLAYDSAAAIVDALKNLQKAKGGEYRTPTVIMLRADPCNETFAKQAPTVAVVAWFMLKFCYEDMANASKLYEQSKAENPDLLEYIFIDPGGLHDPEGTTRTGYHLVVEGELNPMCMYADLGAGMCEVVERRQEFNGKGVGIGATGKVNLTWGSNMYFALGGLKNRLLHMLGLI